MGQRATRTTKRYVEQWFNGRLVRGHYICSACQAIVERQDNFCSSCGLDIREVESDTKKKNL